MKLRLLAPAALVPLLLSVPVSADAATPTLKATVGPDFSITLTKGGKAVHSLKHGKYIIKVSDRSDIHNFRVKGAGVNKATSVPRVYSTTWRVTFKKGTYRFVCDPHPESMKGSFKVT
jgi:plastocyanin